MPLAARFLRVRRRAAGFAILAARFAHSIFQSQEFA